MLIDWFTVAAQIVNFLALVWLLKRFLYGPIVRAIDARESKVAALLADAEAKRKDAEDKLALYQSRLADIEERHEAILVEIRTEAEKRRAEMVDSAREQVRALETQWRQDLDRERNAFLLELRRRSATEILAMARRAVADLACMDVQECAVRVFLEKIRGLDEIEWKSIAGGELQIRSAFKLPEETQIEIQAALEERLGVPLHLKFESAPEMGWGIELRGSGRRIGWSSETYLDAMEEDLREALEQKPEPAQAEVL